jgi:hypothetical protein
MTVQIQLRQADLPLAVYREVAAHLTQVEGVQVELVPQQSPQFNYGLSQIDSLVLRYSEAASMATQERIRQILAYYSDRYGNWEAVSS